jgi:DNA-binding GntR family transcriptional regulator
MFLKVEKIQAPLSLSEIAYVTLKQSLLNRDFSDLPSEERFDERELAANLGLSRTPLREAIHRLAIEGFLKVVPRKGIYVIKKSKRELLEILRIRAVLEGLAARLTTQLATEEDTQKMKKIFTPFDSLGKKDAARIFPEYSQANIDFHELILQLSQCSRLTEIAGTLDGHVRWIRSWNVYSASFQERFLKIHKEHSEIIKAIEKRDSGLAEVRMRAHIEGLADYLERTR